MQYHEYLLMDKIELLQAIEQHKKAIASLTEEKAMFSEYVENARRLSMNEGFLTWSLKNQHKKKILVAPAANAVINEETGKVKSFE